MKKMIITLMLAIISSVWVMSNADNYRLPSLCDEWNIMYRWMEKPFRFYYYTYTRLLTTDTIIHDTRYVKIVENRTYTDYDTNTSHDYTAYLGALREDDNANIYFIPSESDHEYLLYAFNAKVGDTFTNVWCGGTAEWYPNGCKVTISSITETSPKTFGLIIDNSANGESANTWNDYVWIEGVGFMEGPIGSECPFLCAGSNPGVVLCAYKDGIQKYVSETGEEFGCEYNSDPIDISLFHAPNLTEWDGVTGVTQTSRDTLIPINSKEAMASLSGHWIDYFDYFGSTYSQMTALKLISLSNDSIVYDNSEVGFLISIHLTTKGSYMLVAKNDSVDGLILGRVDFEVEPEEPGGIDNPADNYRLPSLCDEWNIMSRWMEIPFLKYHDYTYTQQLTTDTIILGTRYVKIVENRTYTDYETNTLHDYTAYLGALREDDNANIYFIPSESDHEYLLYAFNAKVGDTFTNVWCGGTAKWFPNGCKVTISSITETNPRTFGLSIVYSTDGENYYTWDEYVWVEGVGFMEGPIGTVCPFDCVGASSGVVLCAYKDGIQKYVSETGEEFGCEYNSDPIDIPLFRAPNLTEWDGVTGVTQTSRDTLIPMNTNEAVAALSGHLLYYYDYFSTMYSQMTALKLISLSNDSIVYDNSEVVTTDMIHLTTKGSYMLVAKNDSVDGLILGRVDFEVEPEEPGGIDTPADTIPLYIKDGPGSSTVEPVDPNEIVATLQGDELKVNEYIDKELTLNILHVAANGMPVNKAKALQSETFQDSVTVQLTEEGQYTLQLSSVEWDYVIEGTFGYWKNYPTILKTESSVPTIQKIFRNGQLLLQIGDKIYTLTGTQIR